VRPHGHAARHQQADAGDYDGLVLPGGVANPDQLRTDPRAVRFVQDFFAAGKPVGVICHGAWTLVEADVVHGRRLTSWPSLQTDIRNAGGEWVDALSGREHEAGDITVAQLLQQSSVALLVPAVSVS